MEKQKTRINLGPESVLDNNSGGTGYDGAAGRALISISPFALVLNSTVETDAVPRFVIPENFFERNTQTIRLYCGGRIFTGAAPGTPVLRVYQQQPPQTLLPFPPFAVNLTGLGINLFNVPFEWIVTLSFLGFVPGSFWQWTMHGHFQISGTPGGLQAVSQAKFVDARGGFVTPQKCEIGLTWQWSVADPSNTIRFETNYAEVIG